MNASVQGASTVHKATRPNQNESFFISHDRGPDHPDVLAGKLLRGRNQWPASLPDIRPDMTAYFQALGALCATACSPAFAAALDMPADSSRRLFANEGHANARFLHYPPQDAVGEDNLFGQGAAHRQQLHDRAGAHRRAGPGGAASSPASGFRRRLSPAPF